MPNVLIIGATGYLGLQIARALVRSGNHTVYGLIRNAEKTTTLEVEEIVPIVGDANDPSTYNPIISSTPIDIVIDTSSAYDSASTILHAIKAVGKARTLHSSQGDQLQAKLGFLYVSGSWVHGSPTRQVSDLHIIGAQSTAGPPARAVAWRPAHERTILEARDCLDVGIIRPAQLFGFGGSMWGNYWDMIARSKDSTDPIKLPLRQDSRLAVLHVEDAAEAVRAAVERLDGRLGSWPIFDLVGETIALQDVMAKARSLLGAEGTISWVGPQNNPVHEAMSLKTDNVCERARYALDWQPRKSMLHSLPLLVKAWQASRKSV